MDTTVITALIAGLFGVIGSLVSFLLLMFQSRATNRLERDLRQYQAKLQVGTEVHLRLYERAMEEISKYRLLLKNVHLRLDDYKNGVRYHGISEVVEKKNTFRFYAAWHELRFPGVYVPTDIAKELEAIRRNYASLKEQIYEVGKDNNEGRRISKLDRYNEQMKEMETRCNKLIDNWKNRLLIKENIFEVILSNNS